MTAMPSAAQVRAAKTQSRRETAGKVGWFFLNNGIVLALVVEVAIFALLAREKFWSGPVLAIVLQNASMVGIIMPFYTLAMISGIVDFSTAQVGALSGVVFAVLISGLGLPWSVGLLGGLGLAIIASLINCWVVIKLHIPPIVATLVGGGIANGISYLLAERWGEAMQVRVIVPFLRQIWTVKPLGMPLTVYFMFLMYIVVYVLLNHTKLGAHLYAVGANAEAARRAGIKLERLVIFVFLLLAVSITLGNIAFNLRQMNAGPGLSPVMSASGSGISVTLVAALFAGIGLFGGTGRVEFTLIGLLFFSVLMVGMSVVGFPPQFRVAVDGAAIVLALLLDSMRRYLSSR
jgi:ribose transport system permease protein